MKRISKIVIKNYRAYFDEITFDLPKGENMLIYGENGSGKSSLYRGLNAFVQSFVTDVSYVKNRFANNRNGNISIAFKEYSSEAKNFIGEDTFDYTLNDNGNKQTCEASFLLSAAMTRGFMDYKDLLKVYLHDTNNPNLFSLFVTNILKDHLITGNERLGVYWNRLNIDFFNAKKRSKKSHQRVPGELAQLKIQLGALLKEISKIVNTFLDTYFRHFGINIELVLSEISCSDKGAKHEWFINSDLRMKVFQKGTELNSYVDYLNEARLSAISVCIYLASLKCNESRHFKLLVLDDMFVGLDTGNRCPILNILCDCFFDYQMIIFTYDRQWFSLALNHLKTLMPERWKSYNIFVGSQTIDNMGFSIDVPIVTTGNSLLAKATQYLHHETEPDYPASANYFRKALEELISNNIPFDGRRNKDFVKLADYKLTSQIKESIYFLKKIEIDSTVLESLNGFLPSILHPLSHYNYSQQIYRNELLRVEELMVNATRVLTDLNLSYIVLLEKGRRGYLKFQNIATNYFCDYLFELKENLYLYKKNNNLKISTAKCFTIRAIENDNGKEDNQLIHKEYGSIVDARNKTCEYLNNKLHKEVDVHEDFLGIDLCFANERRALIDVMLEKGQLL